MFAKKSDDTMKTAKSFTARRPLTLLGGLLALTLMLAGTQANAQPVHFRYVGGRWSHGYHAGWHRYWGGPSIGFYFAPAPVYVVPGYAAPSYYVGPTFWANPSFGLNINIGGGYYGGGGYYRGGHYYGGGYHGGSFHSGSFHGGAVRGGSFHGGGGGRGRR